MPSRLNMVASAIRIAGGVVRMFSPVDMSTGAVAIALDKASAVLDSADGALGLASEVGDPLGNAVQRASRQVKDRLPAAAYRDVEGVAVTRVQDAIDSLGAHRCLALTLLGQQEFVSAVLEECEPALHRDLSDRERHAVDELARATHAAIMALIASPGLIGSALSSGLQHVHAHGKDTAARLRAVERELAALHDEAGMRSAASLVSGTRPAQAVNFVERRIQTRLWDQVRESETITIRSLTGMRGVGKSQIASALASRCTQEGWEVVVWVDAIDRDSIVQQLSEIAAVIGVAAAEDTPERACRLLLTWFASQPASDRLIVFDNVVDLDHLRGLLPTGSGLRVVITTNIISDAIGESIDIGLFSRQESISYLEERTGIKDAVGAEHVAELLGDLPVAIAQAATTIRLLGIDYDSYRRQLEAHPLLGAFTRSPGDSYPLAVDVALLASVEAVVGSLPDEDSVADARLVLSAMSVLNEVGIRRSWLVGTAAEELRVRTVVGRLIESSVIGLSDDGTQVSLHRLLARVLREAPSLADINKKGAEHALRIIREALPSLQGDFLARRAHLTDLSTHLRSIVMSASAASASFTAQATELFSDILEAVDRAHVPAAGTSLAPVFEALLQAPTGDPSRLAAAGTQLANALRAAGEHDRAVALQQRSLETFTDLHGALHVHSLASRNNLAHMLLSANRIPDAIDILQGLLPQCERELGDEHRLTFACRTNLAHAYMKTGEIEPAVIAYEELLADLGRVFGPDDEDLLDVRFSLAQAYESARDTGKAAQAFADALAAFESRLGPDHHRTTDSRRGLARMNVAAGHPERAIPLAQRALDDQIRVSGADHHSTIDARGELAAAYEAAGDYPRAIEEFTRTLGDHARIVGASHPETFAYRNQLALVHVAAGNLRSAIDLLAENASELGVLELNDPDIFAPFAFSARTNLAHTVEKDGQFLRAGALYIANARAHETKEGVGSGEATAHWIAAARVARKLGSPRSASRMLVYALARLGHATPRALGQRAHVTRVLQAVNNPAPPCLDKYDVVPAATVWRSAGASRDSGVWFSVQFDAPGASIAPPNLRSRDR